MKTSKPIVAALLVMFSILSVLPGCGKSKDNKNNGIYGAAAYSYGAVTGNGCISVQGNGIASFPIAGQASIGVSGFSAQATVGGNGVGPGGAHYIRYNTSGDTIDVYLNSSQNSIYGVITLSQLTVGALGGGYQPICVQSVVFQNVGVTAQGTLYGPIILYSSVGALTL